MERSDYWRVYAKGWDKVNGGWQPLDPVQNKRAFGTAPPLNYRGRLLRLENYLEVPTFLRLGRRLGI